MYEQYYGFVQSPFSLTPDPRFLYRSESHDEAIKQVSQAIKRREGFIVLTGDIGTGKTTICRAVIEQFDASTFTALILNPFLSVEELLREVLMEFGVVSREGARAARFSTASKHELVHTLYDFLLSLVPLRGSAVIIIDEAQHLSNQVLEEIRILSNLETNEQKLLQIVLVGQLNMLDALASADMRQLDSRISMRCRLKPLSREEVEAYVAHRLWVARGSSAVTFEPKALEQVHRLSGGVPRLINLLCDRGLSLGAEAETNRISAVLIERAAEQLGLHPAGAARTRRSTAQRWLVAVAAAVVVLVAGGAAAWLLTPLGMLGPLVAAPALPPSIPVNRPAMVPPPPLPEGDLAAPPRLRPSRGPATSDTGEFVVLVGVYRNPVASKAAEADLRELGFPVFAQAVAVGERVEHRVLVGRYHNRTAALGVLGQIQRFPEYATATLVTAAADRPRTTTSTSTPRPPV